MSRDIRLRCPATSQVRARGLEPPPPKGPGPKPGASASSATPASPDCARPGEQQATRRSRRGNGSETRLGQPRPVDLAPLDGFVVGVTADRRVGEQTELLRRRGAVVLHGPAIATDYLVDDEPLREATAAVIEARPRVLLATTGIGMRAWFEAAQTWGVADDLLDALAETTVLARGSKAASAVVGAGLTVAATAPDERLASLVSMAADRLQPGDRVVVQCHGGDSDGVFDALRRAADHPPLEVV